jgi:hypothetical protein
MTMKDNEIGVERVFIYVYLLQILWKHVKNPEAADVLSCQNEGVHKFLFNCKGILQVRGK